MARKTRSILDTSKKYRENSKQLASFVKKLQQKSKRDLKKIARQKEAARKKRMSTYKKEAAAKKAENNKSTSRKTTSEPFNFGDFKYLLILVALIILAITTSITIAIIIAFIVLIIKVVLEMKNEEKEDGLASNSLTQEEINELQRHLSNIDIYLGVANNSSDVYAVQCAMDNLLESIDFIMSYDEKNLNLAGLSKINLPAQREFIVEHYDDMLEQARERSAERNENQ